MIDEQDASEVSDLEDEYTLLGELGRGGSAVVYRAHDRTLFRDVAIKVVRPKFASGSEEAIARLEREARTVARLQHPNIVTVHAVKRLRDGGLALVMQLVPGRTLKQVVSEDGPFAPEHAERVIRDVAQALAFAHSKGVVHRDVKPENIFMEAETGRALLSDFGIAHSSEFDSRLTMTGAAIGTPAYMAPEQIDGAPANARSDIYSLGLVGWEMLTGARPWEGEALYNVIFKQKTDQLPAIESIRPGEVPPRLQYIVERMLQKKPAARWAGADGLLTALDHWVVPSDWKQWEESHRRRREAQKSKPAFRFAAKEAASDATVRFARPADGPLPTPPTGGVTLPRGVTPAVHDVDLEDDAPSWASVPMPRSHKALWALAGTVVLMVASVALAKYAARNGARVAQVAPSAVLSDAGSVELPVVAALSNDSQRVANGMLTSGDSLQQAVNALQQRTAESVRADSMAAAARRATQSSPTVAPVLPTVAAPNDAPSAPAIHATDDPGIISAGGRHSCAIVSGKVFCWGANASGQLGDGDLESRDAPTLVAGDVEFAQVTTGDAHTCAVARGGDAYCWGTDEKGQLGDAATTSRSAPVRVTGTQTFRLLRAGRFHTCGLTTAAGVACWGDNSNGQVGDGTTSMRSLPVMANTDVRFVSVTAGWRHTCALAESGAAYCWGDNAKGQLGNGARTDARAPTAVAGDLRFTSIAAGGSHTCAVTETGEAYCWGSNSSGQLGSNGTVDQLTPTAVESAARFASVTAGGVHSCARTPNGQAWCWGRNVYGQLGDGTNGNRESPTRVIGGIAFSSLNATGAHTCGVALDGETSCWGYNVEGQLGDGTQNHRSRPMRITFPGR